MTTTTAPVPATFEPINAVRSQIKFENPIEPLTLNTLIVTNRAPVVAGVLGNVLPPDTIHTLALGDTYDTVIQFVRNCRGALAVALTYDEESFAVLGFTPVDLG